MRLKQEHLSAYNFNVLRVLLETSNFLRLNAGAEIGVFDGGTSWYLLNSFPNLRLISIDPYTSCHEYEQPRLDQAERTAFERLEYFGERSIRIKRGSVSAAALFPYGSLDFVCIDADHNYEPVKKDIEVWYPKVRLGGLFTGHENRWDGVTKAV